MSTKVLRLRCDVTDATAEYQVVKLDVHHESAQAPQQDSDGRRELERGAGIVRLAEHSRDGEFLVVCNLMSLHFASLTSSPARNSCRSLPFRDGATSCHN